MDRTMNLKTMLEQAAECYGTKTAVASGGLRLSFADLDKASNKIANALLAIGVKKGDRVVMLIPNCPEFAVIYFGVVKVGAIVVPLDIKYKIGELASIFNHCEPRVLVTESPYLEPLIPLLPSFSSIEHVIDLGTEAEGQFLSYKATMAEGSIQRVGLEPGPADVAHIAYTSGPSFQPRGVMLTHARLVRGAGISAFGFHQTSSDTVVLFALPMHHAVGLVVILLTSISQGSTVVIVPGVSIESLTEAIERERVTIFMGVPFIHALMVKKASDEGISHDLSSLRVCASAGAPLPIDVIGWYEKLLGLRLLQFYGLTEGTVHVTCQDVDGSGNRPGSVGGALPGWRVKVVDDDGRELPPNRPGEVAIAGPFMKGYYRNPEATAKAIRRGWLYTGDVGRIDEEGHLFILGLKKEMLISKGQNIYPSDVEMVLSSHPKVAEVAVVGVPDKMRGEVVGAAIRLKTGETATEQEMKKFCLERLANYKVPKQVAFLNRFPKNAEDRADKKALKEYLLSAYLAKAEEGDALS